MHELKIDYREQRIINVGLLYVNAEINNINCW